MGTGSRPDPLSIINESEAHVSWQPPYIEPQPESDPNPRVADADGRFSIRGKSDAIGSASARLRAGGNSISVP
ncbi:hypothetical protein APSETT445_006284 [Aspergillus pseudonomiae]